MTQSLLCPDRKLKLRVSKGFQLGVFVKESFGPDSNCPIGQYEQLGVSRSVRIGKNVVLGLSNHSVKSKFYTEPSTTYFNLSNVAQLVLIVKHIQEDSGQIGLLICGNGQIRILILLLLASHLHR